MIKDYKIKIKGIIVNNEKNKNVISFMPIQVNSNYIIRGIDITKNYLKDDWIPTEENLIWVCKHMAENCIIKLYYNPKKNILTLKINKDYKVNFLEPSFYIMSNSKNKEKNKNTIILSHDMISESDTDSE